MLATGAALLAAALSAAAYAQEDEEDEEEDRIVVTGSRIARDAFSSPAPIQVVTAEDAQLRGTIDTTSFLQSATVAAGSPQINASLSSAFVFEGGPGVSTISLRGLGANRTLVLLNGRRAGPAGTRGQVSSFDLNVIPQSSIDRVEILKDGASSIYGSDAIAGVVNIITKSNPDGGAIDVFASQPFEEGGEQYRVSGNYGRSFNRGHFSVSADWYKQETLVQGDRDYLSCAEQYLFDPATGERADVIDPATGTYKCRDTLWGQIWLYDYDYYYSYDSSFNPNEVDSDGFPVIPGRVLLQYDDTGTLLGYSPGSAFPAPRDPGDLIAPPNWHVVDNPFAGADSFGVSNMNHPFIQASAVIPEIERATVFAEGDFDLTDHVTAYAEVLLNRRESRTTGFRQFWTYTLTDNYFLYYYTGPDTGDPFAAGFEGPWLMSPTPITDHFGASQTVDYSRFVGGLRGDFGTALPRWDWDVFVQHSISDGEYTQDVILQDAVDASVVRGGGSSATCVGTQLPVSGRDCIDVNWLDPRFLAGDLTAEERAFLFDVDVGNTEYTQTTVEGVISGVFAETDVGDIAGAFGFHYREDEIEDVPGQITLDGNSWGLSSAGITAGSDTTKEVFGELEVPILRDLPLARSLTLSGSARHTDVDSYGTNTTYKVAANWQIVDQFRLRATQGTSFRAPALFELFLADQTDFLGQRSVDPCRFWSDGLSNGTTTQQIADNCAAGGPGLPAVPGNHSGAGSSATISSRGGLGELEAETSTAWSMSAIWTPSYIDGLNVAVDYFEIEVKDEVTRLGAGNIVLGCYQSEFFPTDPLCSLFTRDPTTFLITDIVDNYINIADQQNRGIDLTIGYTRDTPIGLASFDAQATWALEDTIALFPGFVDDTNGDVGDPDFVAQFDTRLDRGDWTFNWSVSMVGRASDAEDEPDGLAAVDYITDDGSGPVTTVVFPERSGKIYTEFTAYHDLSVRRTFNSWQFLAGVANVFDEAPPAVSQNLGNYERIGRSVWESQYDYIGRRAFVNVTKSF
jgi:iron complex outermembrane receptor protein